ncbi:MAG: Ycf66 family protein [Geminocystis sp.]|nr:Ycf66 family protein [Geminocystis sp.]HIK38828.1 hypothetical protein [Geminocystis sp. M7585_C2015_104]
MLAYFLAVVVAILSLWLFFTAWTEKEIHRQDDFLWSGLGLFYALILWICAGRITGAVLLGQWAVVAILTSFFWENRQLRKAIVAQSSLGGFSLLKFLFTKREISLSSFGFGKKKKIQQVSTPSPTVTPEEEKPTGQPVETTTTTAIPAVTTTTGEVEKPTATPTTSETATTEKTETTVTTKTESETTTDTVQNVTTEEVETATTPTGETVTAEAKDKESTPEAAGEGESEGSPQTPSPPLEEAKVSVTPSPEIATTTETEAVSSPPQVDSQSEETLPQNVSESKEEKKQTSHPAAVSVKKPSLWERIKNLFRRPSPPATPSLLEQIDPAVESATKVAKEVEEAISNLDTEITLKQAEATAKEVTPSPQTTQTATGAESIATPAAETEEVSPQLQQVEEAEKTSPVAPAATTTPTESETEKHVEATTVSTAVTPSEVEAKTRAEVTTVTPIRVESEREKPAEATEATTVSAVANLPAVTTAEAEVEKSSSVTPTHEIETPTTHTPQDAPIKPAETTNPQLEEEKQQSTGGEEKEKATPTTQTEEATRDVVTDKATEKTNGEETIKQQSPEAAEAEA